MTFMYKMKSNFSKKGNVIFLGKKINWWKLKYKKQNIFIGVLIYFRPKNWLKFIKFVVVVNLIFFNEDA